MVGYQEMTKKKKKKSKNIVSSDDCYAEATFRSSK